MATYREDGWISSAAGDAHTAASAARGWPLALDGRRARERRAGFTYVGRCRVCVASGGSLVCFAHVRSCGAAGRCAVRAPIPRLRYWFQRSCMHAYDGQVRLREYLHAASVFFLVCPSGRFHHDRQQIPVVAAPFFLLTFECFFLKKTTFKPLGVSFQFFRPWARHQRKWC